MLVAGVMSGTSLDGIDVALVEIARSKLQTIAFSTTPYPARIRDRILAVSNTGTHTAQISRLNFELGELYARAILKRAGDRRLELIGCHGQTIFHEAGNTLQIGEAAVIAERTGVAVVSNFRARDIAAGGQGAPLVPFFDYRVFRHARRRRVALNIGGIANITVLPPAAKPEDVIAFDTGPGNIVIDQLVAHHTAGRRRFDRNGAIAEKAEPDLALLERLVRDPYYRLPPPKSTGREKYGTAFIESLTETALPLPVLISTVTLLSARTIAAAVGPEPCDLIVSGGGVHNRFLMAHLHSLLPAARISTTEPFGVHPDAKEAIAFALLAWETFHRRPSNVPAATGARHPVVLGEICLP